MQKLLVGALLMAGSITASAGVAVTVGQPGFYGQIILGDAYPVPQVIYPQPVIIQPPTVAVVQPPLYLRVPPGHMKKWGHYCGNYGACGRQVYFVQDNWYQNVYHLATMRMQGDLEALVAVLTNGIIMTITDTGLVKVAAQAMVVVTAMIRINEQ